LTGFEDVAKRVASIRRATELPIAVGFGVQNSSDVHALAGSVDGVVVGSELVRRIHRAGAEGAVAAARDFTAHLRGATDR
jgi:tryptophan synthase alpha chain